MTLLSGRDQSGGRPVGIIKKITKNNEGEKVDKNGGELCEEHEGMSGPDGEGNHGQLCQDEGSKADGT